MSKWQRTLDLKDAWKKAEDREIEAHELAKIIAERLLELKAFKIPDIDREKANLIEELLYLSEDDTITYDDIDDVLNYLYNWGDVSLDEKFGGKKVCWIKTKF